jgi:hypothetical protein
MAAERRPEPVRRSGNPSRLVFMSQWKPESNNVNNRIAAYMLAIDRVAYITRVRGIYA